MSKGWFNHPTKHALVSKGISTKRQVKEMARSGDLYVDLKESSKLIEDIEIDISNDIVNIDFSIQGSRMNSTIIIDTDEKRVYGVIRLPNIDEKQKEMFEKRFDFVEVDEERGGIREINNKPYGSDEFGFRFREYDRERIDPHLNFNYEDVNMKYLDEIFFDLGEWIRKVVYSEIYQ